MATNENTPIIPPGLKDLYGLQTSFVAGQIPALERLTTSVMAGDSLAANPYIRGLYGVLERANRNAATRIRQQTPRGAAQDYAIAQTSRDVALQRGELESQQMQRILQALWNMFGAYNPQQQIGQRNRVDQGTNLGVSLGPVSFNTEI